MAIVANGHGQLHLAMADLAGVHARLSRDHVVERRHAETPARREENAEVLGMPVNGAQQPEDDRRPQKHRLVSIRFVRHFLQTAARAGIGASIVQAVFEDIQAKAPRAIERVHRSLPAGFPEEICASIIAGFETRLKRLDEATKRA
jgi:hypothetical protein